MKVKFLLTVITLCFFHFLHAQRDPQEIPNQFIVTLKETVAMPVVLAVAGDDGDRQADFQSADGLRQTNLAKVKQLEQSIRLDPANVLGEFADVVVGFSAILDAGQVQSLRSNPDVEEVVNDVYFEIEPTVEEETPSEILQSQGQAQSCAVFNAGGFVDGSTKSTWLWILDTGVDIEHPDLNVKYEFPYAKSFITSESVNDLNGHGTHVAGIAAAKDNSFGVVGVSAGAIIVPVKVLNNAGGGSFTAAINGLNHVASYKHTNDVVNLSLGAYPVENCQTANKALFTAIKNLGTAKVWVCIAAGNNGCNALKTMPGCFNGTRVYTVGSMTCGFTASSFSNFHKSVVDWVATGNAVYSTFKKGQYATLSGTSMASPVVAGICHARAAAPVSGGLVPCANSCVPSATYKIAKRQ